MKFLLPLLKGLTASLVLAGILYVIVLLFQHFMTGAIRFDEDSNKLVTLMMGGGGDKFTYRARYKHPDSFQDYVFVYDPSEVYFDNFNVNYTRQNRRFISGTVDTKGSIFPDEPSLRMISLPLAAGVSSRGYKRPSSGEDGNFVVSILTQFFFDPKQNSAANLAKFQAIATKGRFMVKKDGQYVEVRKSKNSYF